MVHALTEEPALQPLSPREIQARVRAGATPQDVAAETGWPLDKVNRYAEPPLGERAYVAAQARAVEISRSRGGSSLEDSVSQRLDVSIDDVAWDAYRTEDARWIVTAGVDGRIVGTWSFDPVGRSVHPQDESARALMGGGPSSVSDTRTASETHTTSDHDASSAPDAAESPESAESQSPRPRLVSVTSDPVASTSDGHRPEPVVEQEASEVSGGSDSVGAAGDQTELLEPSDVSSAPRRAKRAKGKKGRASVPSWDEILFGASRPED